MSILAALAPKLRRFHRWRAGLQSRSMFTIPLNLLVIALAGWLNREQAAVVDYLREENRVLCELIPGKLIRINDDQRRLLAVKGKDLGRRLLETCCGIVTPDTILRWHRKLVAAKYLGSANRGPGRPLVGPETCDIVVRFSHREQIVGDTAESKALCPTSATTSLNPLCGGFSKIMASSQRRTDPEIHHGINSCKAIGSR